MLCSAGLMAMFPLHLLRLTGFEPLSPFKRERDSPNRTGQARTSFLPFTSSQPPESAFVLPNNQFFPTRSCIILHGRHPQMVQIPGGSVIPMAQVPPFLLLFYSVCMHMHTHVHTCGVVQCSMVCVCLYVWCVYI